MILCLPIQVRAKYYPILLGVFFFLVSHTLRLDILVGLGVGLLARFTDKYYDRVLSDIRMRQLEGLPIMSLLRTQPTFVSITGLSDNLISDESRLHHQLQDNEISIKPVVFIDREEILTTTGGQDEHSPTKPKDVRDQDSYTKLDAEEDVEDPHNQKHKPAE